MASTTSTPAAVTTGTSVRNKTTNYYNTKVITLANGSLQRETYRTDVGGNNGVLIQKLSVDNTGKIISKETTSNTTSLEKAALENPNSQLRQSIKSQVNDAKKKLGSDANSDGATNKSFDVASGGSGNSATGTETGDPQAPKTPVEELTSGIKDNAEKIRQQYGNWRYPIDMNSTQDRIKFAMYRYAKKPFQASGVLTGEAFGQRTLGASMGSVVLPIQPTISDSNRVQWGETTMDAGQQAAAGASIAGIAEGVGGIQKAAEGVNADTAGAMKSVVTTTLAEKAGGVTGGGLLTRLTGGVLNSNLELLFQGPSLRTFSFTFSMSARNEKEAKTVRNIIRFFKQGMSVKRSTSNLFIMSPNIFTVKYYYGGQSTEHPWINKIKECALTDCSVNYTPAGNYATYEDGAMTQYDVTLNFSELDFIYDDMYGNGNGTLDETEIGY
jgi:hypothetical protein